MIDCQNYRSSLPYCIAPQSSTGFVFYFYPPCFSKCVALTTKKLIKMFKVLLNQEVNIFTDHVCHFKIYWWPFWIFLKSFQYNQFGCLAFHPRFIDLTCIASWVRFPPTTTRRVFLHFLYIWATYKTSSKVGHNLDAGCIRLQLSLLAWDAASVEAIYKQAIFQAKIIKH